MQEPTWQSMDISGSVSRESKNFRLVEKHKRLIILAIIGTVGVLSVIFFTSSSQDVRNSNEYSFLLAAISEVSQRAKSAHLLMPLAVNTCNVVHDNGFDFIVFINKGIKPENKLVESDALFDPLAKENRDARMLVTDLPPNHVLILNKYPALAGHSLIVTDRFEDQSNPLNESDFRAWYISVNASKAIGIYNSAPEAGSSQRHKHMQLVPLQSYNVCDLKGQLPIDSYITTAASQHSENEIFSLSVFQFQHAVIMFSQMMIKTNDFAEYIYRTYYELLMYLGSVDGDKLESIAPHNVIMNSKWMVVVPRSISSCAGVNINGFGFAGSLVIHESLVAATKPMSLLECVAVARPR